MKKLFPVVLLMSFSIMVNAQKSKVSSASNFLNTGKLDKAKEAIDEGINHEKCVSWSKAYLVKGKVYQGIFESPLPAFKKLSETPLTIALEAFQKAISLDSKGKYMKQIKSQLKNLSIDFINDGVEQFNNEKYNKALIAFESSLNIQDMDIFKENSTVDTAVIWNAGLAASSSKNYSKAIKYYLQALKYNYGGAKAYAKLYNSYKNNNQPEEALKYLHTGFEKFPNDGEMLIALINHYLHGGEPEKAGEYLDKAIEMDPENGSLYSAKGNLYEKTKEYEKAAEMFKKALELNPKDVAALHNFGLMKLNMAIEHHNKVNEIMDVAKYNAEAEKVTQEYMDVVPYFEKVLEINPEEKNSMIILKELYFKLRGEDETYMGKYNKIKAKLDKES
ncbi:MAG: tetratricopeptide repeat protein [Marinifilaceae bacterium]